MIKFSHFNDNRRASLYEVDFVVKDSKGRCEICAHGKSIECQALQTVKLLDERLERGR